MPVLRNALPLNIPEFDSSSALNRPLVWGLRDVLESRDAAMNPNQSPRRMEGMENNLFADDPYLQYRKPGDIGELVGATRSLPLGLPGNGNDIVPAAPAFADNAVLEVLRRLQDSRRQSEADPVIRPPGR